MNLTQKYKQTPLQVRLLVFVLFLLFGAVVAIQTQTNPLFVTGAVAIFYVITEMFIHKKIFFLNIIITAIHLILLSVFALNVSALYSMNVNDNIGIFVGGVVWLLGVTLTVLSLWLNNNVAYGKPIINLVVSYGLFYLVLIFVISRMPSVNLLIPLGITAAVVLTYPFLTKLLVKKGKPLPVNFLLESSDSLTENVNKKIGAYMKEEPKVLVLPEYPQLQFYRTFHNIVVVLSIQTPVVVENNVITTIARDNESVNITDVPHYVLEGSKHFSKKYQISHKKIVPTIVTVENNLPKKITPIQIFHKNRKSKPLGTVLFVNVNVFAGFLKNLSDTPFSSKETVLLDDLFI